MRYVLPDLTISNLFDCDSSNGSCDLTNEIYASLWGWYFMPSKDKHAINGITPARLLPQKLNIKLGNWNELNLGLGADTMNSFNHTFNRAEKWIYSEKKPNFQNNEFKNVYDNPYLQTFTRMIGTIGNFTLVPHKLNPKEDTGTFNQSRGYSKSNKRKYYVCDYWDLSLKLIKENLGDEAFRKYIDTFFLHDYVDRNYHILPLISRHEEFLTKNRLLPHKTKEFLPINEEELNEYLKNVISKIKLRGIRMVHEVQTLQTP